MKNTIIVLVVVSRILFSSLTTFAAADTTIKGTTSDATKASLNVTNASDTSLLFVRNDGNVGIGTTNPGQLLSLEGTRPEISLLISGSAHKGRVAQFGVNALHMTSNLYYDGTNWQRENTAYGGSVLTLTSDLTLFRSVASGANPASLIERMRIHHDGNVGIGTTGPTHRLEVEGGNITIDDWDSQYRGGYSAGGYSDRRMIGGAHGWDSTRLYINGWNDWSGGVSVGGLGGTSNFYVTGNVGIGTTDPGGKLDVSGAFYTAAGQIFLRAQDETSEGGQIYFAGAGTNRYFYLDNFAGRFRFISQDATGVSEKVTILNDGSVGIGTGSPTTGYKLDVIGTVRCESLTQYSSKDYKQDISALDSSDYQKLLGKLIQTKVFRFRSKEADENSKLRLGLIAEESPQEIVSQEGKGIDLGEAISFLIAAVKAQQQQIQTLKEEIRGLKGGL